jgi:hypothetical protein
MSGSRSMSYGPQSWVGTLFACSQQRRGAAREAKREKPREQTRIFLMNWLDNRLDDTLHDTDMIFIALVVPDPHESPCLLLKVPARLNDPVVILFFLLFHPVYKFLHVRILSRESRLGLGPAERTALTHHAPQQDVIKPISTASFKA